MVINKESVMHEVGGDAIPVPVGKAVYGAKNCLFLIG